MIEEKFPAYREKIAAGLVGDGSECFGFDDEISQDHDWGPAFCLWLTKEDYGAIGTLLRNEVDKLPREFAGIKAREESFWGTGRTGVFEIGEFYKRFIGFNHVPEGLREWQAIPEENLAAATNGKVFMDPVGEFTAFRQRLKEFYPEDLRLKKIASRCMTMAQSGQYNYTRCIRRGEYVAARLAEAHFINDTISMVFLLNKQYKPFYKWMHRAVKQLPILGDTMYRLFSDLVSRLRGGTGRGCLYQEKRSYGRGLQVSHRGTEKTAIKRLRKRFSAGPWSHCADKDKRCPDTGHECLGRVGEKMTKEEIIAKIIAIEWKMFQDVPNIGGTAPCQEERQTFEIMRMSQAASWSEAALESYLDDLIGSTETGTKPYDRKVRPDDEINLAGRIRAHRTPGPSRKS